MADGETSGRESARERITRTWSEMLQELRVAQTGVQVLTGFLLTLPFTTRFGELDRIAEFAYLVTVSSSIAAAGLLIAPVAFHRVLFGRSEKEWMITAANSSARLGLTLLALTMSGVMFLVFDIVVGRVAATVATTLTLLGLAAAWVILPLVGVDHHDSPPPSRHRTAPGEAAGEGRSRAR